MLRLLFLFSETQEDEKFLTEVFAQLTDEATEDGKRRELVRAAERGGGEGESAVFKGTLTTKHPKWWSFLLF